MNFRIVCSDEGKHSDLTFPIFTEGVQSTPTIIDLIHKRHIGTAKDLLVDSNLVLEDIVESVGSPTCGTLPAYSKTAKVYPLVSIEKMPFCNKMDNLRMEPNVRNISTIAKKNTDLCLTFRTYPAGGDFMKTSTYTQLEAFLRTGFDIEGNSIKDRAQK